MGEKIPESFKIQIILEQKRMTFLQSKS